tara:strand:+ start:376 stop:999 length:624 start_codon:yes stop_codon:yes gene_type:complete
MDVFAIVFLFAIVGLIIYFFIYRANKNIKHQSDQVLTNEFLDSETEEINFLEFGFPENAENIFKGRHIDTEKGIAVIKNRSHFGIALCVHARLSYTRLYFYVDFDHFDRPSPVIFIIGDNEERVMLKVNSESAMFSHDNLRYFDAKIDSKDIFLRENLTLEINNIKYNIKEEDLLEIQKALVYVKELDDDQGKFLKKWRKLNDNINN